jgi:GH35 family endo-1,4-beta-xylanase
MMNPRYLTFVASLLCASAAAAAPTLRSVFKDDFMVGVAMNHSMVDGRNARAGEIAASQFSALTPKNDMKWQSLHPEPGKYRFEAADAYVEFGRKNDMAVIGHTLVWHSQTPAWVFQGKDGKFEVFPRHRKDIGRVTLWGLDDGQTWLNDFPIRGRTNHPLLINRELLPKPAFFEVLKTGQSSSPKP